VLEERLQDIVCQVVDGLIVYIMFNVQEVALARIGAIDSFVPDVLAVLDQIRVVVQVALRIQVKVSDVISQLS
jgi:hypothetical protein